MNFKQFLNERYGEYNSNNVIVVDIQPMYCGKKFGTFSISRFGEFIKQMLNKSRKVLYFYNGMETVGEDTQDDIIQWLIERMMEEGLVDSEDEYALDQLYYLFNQRIIWHDKGYGYLRPWMDQGVSDSTIIQTIRCMAGKHINDSRDLAEKELKIATNGEDIPEDPLIIPSIPLNTLKQFSGAYICGGGRDECLREVQLLMNAFNIKYIMFREFIY